MEQKLIEIAGETFIIIDKIEKISVSDSFVLPTNKVGLGNGEAKLYVGHDGPSIIDFFGSRGFEVDCFFTRENLLQYLENSYTEYKEPKQKYRDHSILSGLWEKRYSKIDCMDQIIRFRIKDQNQLGGPRIYINASNDVSDKNNYLLLREIPLPIISYINIFKVENKAFDISYYFTINLTGNEDSEIAVEPTDREANKFIPGSLDTEDVEKEISNDLVEMDVPFDPNKIKIRTSPSTVGNIISDLQDGFIDQNTEFQRLPNLWDDVKKSRFIESMMLKLPIPAFYFNEKEENELEVIDGLQRISTINSFVIKQDFMLSNLEFLKECTGLKFSELPSTLQRRIRTFPITTHIIEKGTPIEVKYNVFKRINTGGLELTEQEIRHAINQGTPAELIADLARGDDEIIENNTFSISTRNNGKKINSSTREGREFVKVTDNRIGTFRMEDRDFVTRFVAFYLIDYLNYEPNLDTFLNTGMAKIRELDDLGISVLKEDFYNSMKLCYEIFGNDSFRKRFNERDARKPINKALFEVLSVSFAKLTSAKRTALKLRSEKFKKKFIELHRDGSFLKSISQSTAIKIHVIKRFEAIQRIIEETLEND